MRKRVKTLKSVEKRQRVLERFLWFSNVFVRFHSFSNVFVRFWTFWDVVFEVSLYILVSQETGHNVKFVAAAASERFGAAFRALKQR